MRGEFARRSPPHAQYEGRRYDHGFESHRSYGPRFPPRGARSPPVRHGGSPLLRRGRVDFVNPSFEKMAQHWFDSFCANPSVESFAHSSFCF